MYTFNSMTEEQLDALSLVPPGNYDFEVLKATKKVSKTGNPMAELQVQIWDAEGRTHNIYDYLVFSGVPLNIRKISHFCKAVGLKEAYDKGQLPEDLYGYSGKCKVDVRDPQPNPNGGFYDKKNVIVDYLESSQEESAKRKEAAVQKSVDEDIPF